MKHFIILVIFVLPLFGQSTFEELDSLITEMKQKFISGDSSISSDKIDEMEEISRLRRIWQVVEDTDEMTDERVLQFGKVSNEMQSINYGQSLGIIKIISRNGDLSLYVYWGGFIRTEGAQVTYRIGTEEAKTEYWSMSTNRKATYARKPVELINKMKNENQALFRVTPYGDNPITYSFDITGLDSIINQYPEDFVSLDEGDEIEKRVKFIPYDDPPKPLTPIRSKYPKVAQDAGNQGTVVVQVFVNNKGKVEETIILKGLTPELNQAAIEAIKKTKFKPAMQRGKPVGVWSSIPVNFRLDGWTATWNSDEVEKNSGEVLFNENEKIVLFSMVAGLLFLFVFN